MIEDPISLNLTTVPTHINDVVRPWAERTPDRPAIVDASGTWTYGQLTTAIAETQSWLLGSGVRPGDRVMVVCENCRSLAAVLFAVAGLDAWPVPVNARFSPREIDQIRDHCRARRVLYTTSVSPHAREHSKRHGAINEEVGIVGPVGIGPLDESAVPELLDGAASERVAAVIYTSGTTGLPKGVMLSHRNLLFIAALSSQIRHLTPDDRMYGVLPMSHITGLSVTLLGTLLSGATLYIPERFDPLSLLTALEKHQLTIMLGVPGMYALLVEYAKVNSIRSFKFPSLRIISSSGAQLDAELKKSVEKLFDLVLHNAYGVTECSPTIAQTRVEEPRSDTSVGRISPHVEVRLIGPDGNRVEDEAVGELRVRGPNLMKGYYRAPAETADAIDAEGWFNTRDLARLEGGNLFIVGRTKELIVRFGFNVYPGEVEAVLNGHPGVARAAVIGRPVESRNGDEQIIAFVQIVAGSNVTAAELSKFAGRNLTTYKRPSHILLVDDMPMTPTGKIAKRELANLDAFRNLSTEGY